MKALFVYTAKVFTCSGSHFTNNLPSSIWRDRYRRIFDEIIVYARNVEVETCNETKSDYNGVSFELTSLGINKKELILKSKKIYKEIERIVEKVDFVICRMGFFGVLAAKCARKHKKPYVCEVVGSSWDDLWNYSLFGKFAAFWLQPRVKNEVKKSKYTVYVTNEYLQREYPCKGKTIGISNVILSKHNDDVETKRIEKIDSYNKDTIYVLGTAAAIDVPYKGQRFVIDAIAELSKKRLYFEYHLAGNGNKNALLKYALEKGVSNQVKFIGALPHEKMKDYFSTLDIYVQPSLQEGLPRAMIEAMGNGLPAIGFETAGIPELIEREYVCRRKSVDQIVKAICKFVSNKDLMKKVSQRNFEKSFEYEKELLEQKWFDFYSEATNQKQ